MFENRKNHLRFKKINSKKFKFGVFGTPEEFLATWNENFRTLHAIDFSGYRRQINIHFYYYTFQRPKKN